MVELTQLSGLRPISSHFEAMEDNLHDSRARHIRLHDVMEKEDDEEDQD